MTTIVGGLRTRYVHDSLHNMLEDALTSLGWFDMGRGHESVTLRSTPVPEDTEALPNIVALDLFDSSSEDVELGNSVLTTDTYIYAIDVYAESHPLGLHLAGDIRDILKGKMSTIGRTGPVLDLYDLSLTTPTVFARAEILDVSVEKSRIATKPYQKNWWVVFLSLEDDYSDEAD